MDFVCVHPLGMSAGVWDPIEPLLAPHGRVIARDLPGFGAEPALPATDEHSVPNLATAVEGWLDEAGLESAHMVGCSMGGAIVLELARRGRAISTTAISPAAGMKGRFEPAYGMRQTTLVRDIARRLRGHERRLFASTALRPLLYSQYGHPTRPSAEALAAASERLADAPGFDDACRSLFEHYGRIEVTAPTLAEIRSPVQVLWGSRDALLFPRQGRRIAAAIPGAELRYLRGLGHVAMWDDPALCAELIVGFAARSGGSRRH